MKTYTEKLLSCSLKGSRRLKTKLKEFLDIGIILSEILKLLGDKGLDHHSFYLHRCMEYSNMAYWRIYLNLYFTKKRSYLQSSNTIRTIFVKWKSTCEKKLILRLLVIMGFTEYQKAFDCLSWLNLGFILISVGTPRHLMRLYIRIITKES